MKLGHRANNLTKIDVVPPYLLKCDWKAPLCIAIWWNSLDFPFSSLKNFTLKLIMAEDFCHDMFEISAVIIVIN